MPALNQQLSYHLDLQDDFSYILLKVCEKRFPIKPPDTSLNDTILTMKKWLLV